MLVKMAKLSPLTDERMRRNEEKCEEKIRPPDSITKAAPKWSQGRPEMESGPPRIGVRGPYFPLMFLLISPHPLICERGEFDWYLLSLRHKGLFFGCLWLIVRSSVVLGGFLKDFVVP